MTERASRIWMCGIPGSKWSGIDMHMRQVLPCDQTDESDERTCYHRASTPEDTNNGHRGSYWGPGMGCGEDWIDFNFMDKSKIINDIDEVFTGTGYKIIKDHFLARKFNLDYVWNNFSGDYVVLVYREPQKSFAWWSEVMDFSEGHYPDYAPGYTDYNTMRKLLWTESVKITDFAVRKDMNFSLFNNYSLQHILGFDIDLTKTITIDNSDTYISVKRIP